MTNIYRIAITLIAVSLAACGGPARTQTTSSTSVDQMEGGSEVRTSTTETIETEDDGSRSTNRVETTQTETPAP